MTLACCPPLGHGNKGVISKYKQTLPSKACRRIAVFKQDSLTLVFLSLFLIILLVKIPQIFPSHVAGYGSLYNVLLPVLNSTPFPLWCVTSCLEMFLHLSLWYETLTAVKLCSLSYSHPSVEDLCIAQNH